MDGGRPRSRSAVASHPTAFQAMPAARPVDLPGLGGWRAQSKPIPCGTVGVQIRAGDPAGSPSVLVVPARLERATPAFGRRCSDPLSYGTKDKVRPGGLEPPTALR